MRIISMRFCYFLLVLIFCVSFVSSQQPRASDPSQTPAISQSPIKLQPDPSGLVPQAQFRELLRYAQDREVENEKRLRDYTYVEREEEHKLDGSGNVKKTETRTREVLQVYGEEVERLTAKDDKPLSDAEAKKEEEKIQKVIDKYKNESESSRRKRLEKEEKERQEERKFVLEIADAFTFRLVGSEILDGRDTWVIEGDPRAGYEPKERSTKILSKFKGRVWIDKTEGQWVRLDITAIDSISVGWFLARIRKGMHIEAEQTKINDEVWLPKHVAVRVDARLALLKSYNEDVDETFRDYKKFRTESKITAVGETQ
ncbi:MAG: hypothetical protein WBV36_26570 [Terriglobales bacterium]